MVPAHISLHPIPGSLHVPTLGFSSQAPFIPCGLDVWKEEGGNSTGETCLTSTILQVPEHFHSPSNLPRFVIPWLSPSICAGGPWEAPHSPACQPCCVGAAWQVTWASPHPLCALAIGQWLRPSCARDSVRYFIKETTLEKEMKSDNMLHRQTQKHYAE